MSPRKLAVYLDVSTIGRLFDDQSQLRIRLETDAVRLIMAYIADGSIQMASSAPLLAEIEANPAVTERRFFQALFRHHGVWQTVMKEDASRRVRQLVTIGMSEIDALHVTIAEACQHAFVTCDDRLLKQLARSDVGIWYGTPVAFCMREDLT